MEHFVNWSKWLILKESKSRKKTRKKRKSNFLISGFYLNRSDSDSDSSDGEAGDVSESKTTIKNPDYSFDSWLKKIEKLSDEVNQLIKKGTKDDQEIDKKKKELEKEKIRQQKKPKRDKEMFKDISKDKKNSKEDEKKNKK